MCVYISDGMLNPFWGDIAYNLGVLLAKNGYADHVRYADMGQWTGDPLPNPASCPSLGAIQPCGGACGACPAGTACVGRAPLHPVGFCAPQDTLHCAVGDPNLGCDLGQSCFTYVVQPAVQKDADAHGICLSTTDCDALAAALPGGGKCAP